METRTTYRQLISPLAQLDAVQDFVGQMESIVHDSWRDSDDPEDNKKAESESARDFLEDIEEEVFAVHASVLRALLKLGLRFEVDGEEEAEGFFHLKNKGWPIDLYLHKQADRLTEILQDELAPDGWSDDETYSCLGWENLVLVPDQEGAIRAALRILGVPVEAAS